MTILFGVLALGALLRAAVRGHDPVVRPVADHGAALRDELQPVPDVPARLLPHPHLARHAPHRRRRPPTRHPRQVVPAGQEGRQDVEGGEEQNISHRLVTTKKHVI